MKKLILASQNRGKQAEMCALLAHLPLTILLPQALDRTVEIAEIGSDYAENALIKAHAFAQAFGQWTLGDDTGLEVEVLGGAPGLRSARMAGPGAQDQDRRQALLKSLASHPRPWEARFVSVVALVSPQGDEVIRRGECLGEIIPAARGTGGFGYDPIFLVAGSGKTMAELAMDEKNKLSHRAVAIQAILPEITRQIASR